LLHYTTNYCFFSFQAEDGIRYRNVTGVQTCALPILGFNSFQSIYDIIDHGKNGFIIPNNDYQAYADTLLQLAQNDEWRQRIAKRSEERRVGKEGNEKRLVED